MKEETIIKKVFVAEYPDELISEIGKWLEGKLYKEDGGLSKLGYRPTVIIEIIND